MNYYKPQKLLSTKNTKTIKGEKYGWVTYILYMSPYTQNATGKNLCSHATKGCAEACLVGSGRGGMYVGVKKGRVNKSDYFIANRVGFFEQMYNEITKIVAKHKKKEQRVCIRLNGTTDLAWEKFKIKDNKSLMELFPDVQFYDYTKNHFRFGRILPANYSITFSRSEENEEQVEKVLASGGNVAIIFDKLPKTYKGYEVVNGDESDLRFNDKKNVVVGLKYKNMTGIGADNSKAFKSGFALRKSDLDELDKAAKKAA